MEIITEDKQGGRKVRIEGDLTIYNARELKKALDEMVPFSGAVELDLSGAGEMDTAGFQLMYLAFREARKEGAPISISGARPQVSAVISLYGMVEYFSPVPEKITEE